jgi:hypothetical protein
MNMVAKTLLFLPAMLLSLAALADPAEVRVKLERAASIHEQARVLEHAWLVTGPLIAEAEAALDAGETAEAEALASRALLTAEQSLAQARRERDAWRERVLGE